MRKSLYIVVAFFTCLISSINSYSFSVSRPAKADEQMKYEKGSECMQLSCARFAELTVQKTNLFYRTFFKLVKLKTRHDNKRHANSWINKLFGSRNTGFQKVLFWILIGVFVLAGIFFIIYGFAPR